MQTSAPSLLRKMWQLRRDRIVPVITVAIFSVAAAVGCGSDDDEVPASADNTNATSLVESAAQAMADLRSYRMEFSFRPEGEPVTFLVDYSDPGDYYERLVGAPETEESFELVLLGDDAHGRQCRHYPSDCEQWQQLDERPPVPGAGGFTTVAPETLGLTALDLTGNAEIVETVQINDTRLILVRGSVRLGATILENKRRVYGQIDDYWKSCESTDIVVDGKTSQSSEPTCRSLSFEEYVEEEYGDVSFDSEPLAPIHVWLSPDDSLVHRIAIGLPGTSRSDEPESASMYFDVTFSLFNEVMVGSPED